LTMDQEDKKQALSEQILADARKKAERIVKRAKRDAARIMEEAEREGEKAAENLLAETEQEAEAEFRRLTAGIPSMKARKMLAAEEKILESVMDEAMERLRERFDADPAGHMRSLLLGAVFEMPEDEMVVEVCERDRGILTAEFLEKIAAEVRDRQGRRVQFELPEEAADISGGVIVRAKSGRTIYDNSFEARAKRLREELRRRAAAVLFPDG